MTRPRLALLVAAAAALSGLTLLGSPAQAAPVQAAPVQAPQPAARYVALGSSYAAGGGLGTPDPAGFPGCGRTTMAYPYLVAGALDLDLVNAACGGATIDNITGTPQRLQGWDGSISSVPRQIESVGSDTGLVTITIGGNDVNYVGNLMAEACLGDLVADPASPIGNGLKEYGLCTPRADALVLDQLAQVEDRLIAMVRAVQAKAPRARIVLVDYVTVLPPNGKACAAMPIPQDRQKFLLEVARTLSLATKHAAQQAGVEYVAASKAGAGHDACSADPWVIGYDFSRGFVIMHPNEAGHAAVADAILRQLTGPGRHS